ncbi:uncharacterized protein [Haliotis asinina]|uniref:uncharacterized protein n=1 Tax=Haliotis asinina TaxID=109174 RepID=UPI003531C589
MSLHTLCRSYIKFDPPACSGCTDRKHRTSIMRVFLVLCILAVSRADHLHDILQRHAVTSDHIEDIAKSIHKRSFLDTLKNGFEKFGQEVANIAQKALPVVEQVGKDLLPTLEKVAPSLISAGLTALVGKRDVHRRNIFDDIKKGLETVGNAITTAAKAALPVVEEIGKQVLPVAEKVAPSLISAGLTALVGKRDVHFRDQRSFLDDLKKTLETLGQQALKAVETLAPTVIESALPALLSSVGKRDHHFRDQRSFLDDLKKTLETLGQQALKAVETLAPTVIESALPALLSSVGKRDHHFRDQRSFLDDLKKTLETLGQQALKAVETLAPTVIESALPALLSSVGKRDHHFRDQRSFLDDLKKTLETLGQQALKAVETLAPTVIESALPALLSSVGKRDHHFRDQRSFLDDLKKTLETLGQQALKAVETLAPTVIESALPALLSSVGKRDHHFRDQRSFLDDLKKTLETLGQQALKAVETLAPTVIESALPALLSSVGKRDHVEAGLLGHVRDEMLSVVDKLKESVEGAEKIATNLESNLKTAAQGLTSGQDVKALAQLVLSTLEADVKSMIDKGTFDVDIDSLIKNIVPNAFAKLFSKNSRRSLPPLGDLHGLLSGTAFGDLSTFLRNIESAAVQSLSPALSKLKALAQTFLTHAGQATAQVAAEAVKFFQPFQAQLGSVFTQIENVAAKLTSH